MALCDHVYAHYKLNSVAGIVASDSSGNGRDGTLINMEGGDWVAGKLNNCLRFNEGSTDEYVTCGNIASFERTDSFSIECWVKILGSPLSSNIEVFTKHDAVYKGWQLQISGDYALINIANSGSNRIRVHGSTNMKDGNWHHVIATYDGSSTAAGVRIYVDGSLETMTVLQNNLTLTVLNAGNVHMSVNNANHYVNGYLDELVIYDTEITSTDVSFRWNSGNGRENFTLPPPTLSNPIPIDGATGISYNQNLDWDSDGVKWDIYFGTGSPPPLIQSDRTSSDYTIPYNLNSCTQYYWKIVAYNILDGTTTGAIWDFTTGNEPPVTPHTPYPVHNAIGQNLDLTLSWDSEDYNPNDTVVYDIYFGTACNPPLKKANHGSKSYTVTGLSNEVRYYWKIVAKDNAACGVHDTASPIWNFKTKAIVTGGYTAFDPRKIIREQISVTHMIDKENEKCIKVTDDDDDDAYIPMYMKEEAELKCPPFPHITFALLTIKAEPHDIKAAVRKHKALIAIDIAFTDMEGVDVTSFGKKIADRIVDLTRSYQTSTTGVHFLNVWNQGRVIIENRCDEIVFHWILELEAIYSDAC